MTMRLRLGSCLLFFVALLAVQAGCADSSSSTTTKKATPATNAQQQASPTADIAKKESIVDSHKIDINAPLPTLSPKPVYKETTVNVVNALSHHYSSLPFNDALSQDLLARYLKRLDPNRLHFLQSDINTFKQFQNKLDDQLSEGSLKAGYLIFNTYMKRASARLHYLLSLLNNGIDKLDYQSDKTVLLDRSKADWPTKKNVHTLWRKHLINSVINMRLDGTSDEDITKQLTDRYENRIKRLHQNSNEDVFQIYLNSLTSLYDPHTDYFTPERLANFNIDMSHSLEGIGAVLQTSDGFTKIVRLVQGGPAASSGKLAPSDRIIAVGQGSKGDLTNIVGWRISDVVKLIRGPKGSTVRLKIIPASATGEHSTKVITITRDKIKLEAQAATKSSFKVTSHGNDYRIGVIDLPAFYQDFDAYRRGDPNYTSSYHDVKKLLTQLKKTGINGLIIDLRNNGGGSLSEAIRLVSLFVDGGPTVQIRDASGRISVENDVYPGALYHGPMIVLVNRFSASASEIFTGAMQDYGRALIVGSNTFGKGTVQTLLGLNYGDIKITEAKFYRISGSSNQLRGIIPDIKLPYIIDHDDTGESSRPNALPWDHIAAAKYQPMFNFGPYLDELVKAHKKRIKDQPNFVYVRKMKQLLLDKKERKTLSLNVDKREALRDKVKQESLAIENARRVAKGKKPVDSLEALDKTEEKEAKASKEAKAENKDKDKKPDAYREEAGKILGDLITLMKKQGEHPTHQWK